MTTNDQTQEDLHLVFQTSLDDIRFAKRQQWRITYYSIILMGTIEYFSQKFNLFLFSYSISSSTIIFLIMTAAVLAFIKCESDISKYRDRLSGARKMLSTDFKDIYRLEETHSSWIYSLPWILFLCGPIVATGILLIFSSPISPK